MKYSAMSQQADGIKSRFKDSSFWDKKLEITLFCISAQQCFVFTMAGQGKSVSIYSSEIRVFFSLPIDLQKC